MTVADSDIIIGVFSTIASILDGVGDFLSTTGGMVVALSAASIIGLNILGTKIRENKIAKENNALQAKINLQELKEKKLASDNLLIEKRQTLEKKEQLITSLKEKKANETITADELLLLETTEKEAGELRKEIEYEQQRNNILNESLKLQETQTNNVLGLKGAWSGITGILGTAFSIIQGIAAFSTIILKLKKKEGKETDKNTAKTLKQAAAEKIKAAFGMAGSASEIPVAGWVIAIGILAALGVAAIAAATASASAYKKSAEGTADRINDLSNKIYKLNEQAVAIDKITDSFDNLDNKLIKTKKDLEEMNNLMEQAAEKLSDEGDFQDGKTEKEWFLSQDEEAQRLYLDRKQAQNKLDLQKKRNEQKNTIEKLNSTERKKLFDESSTDADIIAAQGAIYALNNAELYNHIDLLKENKTLNNEEAAAIESVTQAMLENMSVSEA